ncbi:hypothetical protein LX36DRAFT_753660 [Colletotrichum falcatum]|nr:hypothetical protein LX36DRAFT_753660 [Colletotrichum falcatum]
MLGYIYLSAYFAVLSLSCGFFGCCVSVFVTLDPRVSGDLLNLYVKSLFLEFLCLVYDCLDCWCRSGLCFCCFPSVCLPRLSRGRG